jgi:periplasmic protein TonB
MLAKPAEITRISYLPIPPYSHNVAQRHAPPQRLPHRPTPLIHTLFQPPNIPTTIVTRDPAPPNELIGPEVPIGSVGPETKGLVDVFNTRVAPARPAAPPEKKRLVIGHVDPALLIHRVEPVYPAIPMQLHRSGKVELRAIIATDGSIQSLEVVSGDPLFIQSALDAVRQWRYRPTMLNGQPVEIDTFITVVYTVNQP